MTDAIVRSGVVALHLQAQHLAASFRVLHLER